MKKKKSRLQSSDDIPGLLPGEAPLVDVAARPAGEHRFFYVTNATNLHNILASGLIRPCRGWPKYVPDVQEQTPGYVPLFCGGVPRSQVTDQVTKHDRHDLPVIIEFNAASWPASQVLCATADGMVAPSADLPNASQAVVLLCGVIPLADAARMYFATPAAAKRFSSDWQALSNGQGILLDMGDSFAPVPEVSPLTMPTIDPPTAASAKETKKQMRRIDAVGGILSALARMPQGGGGAVIVDSFPEWPTSQQMGGTPALSLPDEIVSTLRRWVQGEPQQADRAMPAALCRTLDFLAEPRAAMGIAPESLLDTLAQGVQCNSKTERERLSERLQSIRRAAVYGESASMFFQGEDSPVLRGLLLFLLDPGYLEDRTLPRGCSATPQDLLMAEVMRGGLNGWSTLPAAMRGNPHAELAVGYAMARLANRSIPGSVQFGPRAFLWMDERAQLAAILQKIADIVGDKASPEDLQKMVSDEQAGGIDVRVKTMHIKGASAPVVHRELKRKGKNATLAFTLEIPWP
jgi:hypothetical protein